MAGQSILTRQKESNMKGIKLSRDPEDIASFNGENVTDVVLRFLFKQTKHVDKFEVAHATGLTAKQCQGALSRIRCAKDRFKVNEFKSKEYGINGQKLTRTLLVKILVTQKPSQKEAIKKKDIDKKPVSNSREMSDDKNNLWAKALRF